MTLRRSLHRPLTGAMALAAVLLAPLPARAESAAEFRAAAERVVITPARLDGLNPMSGKAFDTVHDPIHARLLLLQLGREQTVFVSIDAIEVGDMDPWRARIAQATGIPADHIMITATHDHNAPRLGDVTPGALAHPGGPDVQTYTRTVIDQVIEAIGHARSHLVPARYGVAKGHVDVNVNRDEYSPGRGWHIGYAPDGPSDKVLRLVRFDDAQGRAIAVILNYPVHANAMLGANVLSGDITGAAARYVEDGLGGGAVALYAQGAIGDQSPRVFLPGPKTTPAAIEAAWRTADAQGVMIGAEALRLAGAITATRPATHLAAAQAIGTCPAKQGVNQMADMKQQAVAGVPLHLSLMRFDDVALAGVGGEVVTRIYWHLLRQSPLADTLLVSLTNDRIGYLPDDAAYDTPIFEVNGSPLARGCGEDAIVGGITALIATTAR